MKIIAKRSVQVDGFGIVERGRAIDLPEDRIDNRIAALFVRADGSPIVATATPEKAEEAAAAANSDVDKIARTVEVMKREGIMQALDGMGVTYAPHSKTSYLAKLLLVTKGEIEG